LYLIQENKDINKIIKKNMSHLRWLHDPFVQFVRSLSVKILIKKKVEKKDKNINKIIKKHVPFEVVA
jgi:hypothetical protein